MPEKRQGTRAKGFQSRFALSVCDPLVVQRAQKSMAEPPILKKRSLPLHFRRRLDGGTLRCEGGKRSGQAMVDRRTGEFNYRGLKVDLDSSPIGSPLYPSQFGDFDLVTFLSLSMHRVGFPLLSVELFYLLQSASLLQRRATPKKEECPSSNRPSRRPHVASEIK